MVCVQHAKLGLLSFTQTATAKASDSATVWLDGNLAEIPKL